ncbi:MAG TPA: hypothetical protein VNR65_16055 [Geobacterales bacterium]|nr:hypothetical protein [Geobacterales bacterium]
MTDAEARSSTVSATLVAQYETLRSAMLGEALPPDARSWLIVFLRHGMWEWARTLTLGTRGQEPLSVSPSSSAHPTEFGERRAVIHLLAAMAMTINHRRRS